MFTELEALGLSKPALKPEPQKGAWLKKQVEPTLKRPCSRPKK